MANTRILVVDDNEDLADTLADILVVEGHEVEVAYTGESALEKIRDADFDIVLMDVRMPGMNGVESFLEIQRMKPGTRVIIMSGYSVEQLLEQAVENGAWAVLQKPLDPAQIVKMIADMTPAGILIADDDPTTVKTLKDILETRGHDVCVAHDGGDAVEQVRNNDFSVLILDLRMPVLNGLSVYLELKRTGHSIRTIIVTGFAGEETNALNELSKLPVSGILRKPFDPQELVDLVEGKNS